MQMRFIVLFAAVVVLASGTVEAAQEDTPRRIVFEQALKAASNAEYKDILRQAWSKGLRFTPEQIERGARRHFEELKLQLIDKGYVILAGEAGA
jgi:hypothetical protein